MQNRVEISGRGGGKPVRVRARSAEKTRSPATPAQSRREAAAPGIPLTIRNLVSLWLALSLNRVKLSSYERYRHLAEQHILPGLGKLDVSELTVERLNEFTREKQERGRIDGSGGLSAKTVSDILVILRSSIKLAMREYGVRVDAGVMDVRPVRSAVRRVEVFSQRETERITTALKEEPRLHTAGFLLCLETGLRLGELCALRWGDIDFDEGLLSVRRTVLRVDHSGETRLEVQAPKTENSERVVPLTKKLLTLLRMFRKGHDEDEYVFTGSKDRPMEPRTMQYRFEFFLKKQGIRPRGFHTLRHSFATRCVERGVDVKTLSEVLGHSNVQTTLQMYVHPSMDQKRKSVESASSMK